MTAHSLQWDRKKEFTKSVNSGRRVLVEDLAIGFYGPVSQHPTIIAKGVLIVESYPPGRGKRDWKSWVRWSETRPGKLYAG